MGINRLPKIQDHLSTKWPFGGQSFSRIMSRDRFSIILRFFHINDSSGYITRGQPGYDALYKIRPLLDRILQNFKEMYKPNRELALDEAMVSRVWFLQYLPKKTKKWGIKAFALADLRTGYVINWSLYTGKTTMCFASNNTISTRTCSTCMYPCTKKWETMDLEHVVLFALI